MNSNNIIEANNISLTFHIAQSFNLKRFFTKTEITRELTTVEALKNVSFSLEYNKKLGIIGTNGSGKSTLMRILAKSYQPDLGTITINSNKVQLLSLGVGFIDVLTGRDNLYLNALLIGISKEDLDNGLAQEIIEFSELGKFIDFPVYTYSSGMRSRLTFSVAACAEPELLLLDEVFSVGDAHFRAKSQKRMTEMLKSNNSMVMISHDTNSIESFCDKAIWLHKGELMMSGVPEDVMKEYKSFTNIEAK